MRARLHSLLRLIFVETATVLSNKGSFKAGKMNVLHGYLIQE